MYTVYILRSQKDGRTYVGYTRDLKERLRCHNTGLVVATRYRRPLKLIRSDEYELMGEAKKKERYWKSGAGRRRMKELFE